MKPRLVLVGAGHAHLGAFAGLTRLVEEGYPVTVISQDPHYCYSGMAPGVLGGQYDVPDMSLDIGSIVSASGASFLPHKVVRVDPLQRLLILDNDTEETYDVVSFNIGSVVPTDGLELESDVVVLAKPIINFFRMRDRLEALLASGKPVRVLIAGGGPAGLEIGANICSLARRRGSSVSTTIVTSDGFMRMLRPVALAAAKAALDRGGITVMENRRLQSVIDGRACLQGGEDLEVDLVIIATGVRPESLFRDSGLPTADDGGLLVNARLQCPRFPEIFAAGDCATLVDRNLPRIGAVACQQNHVIAKNIAAALKGRRMSRFRPKKSYLQIFNLGGRRGLIVKGGFFLRGRLAFHLKDAIDRRFIRRLRKSLLNTTDKERT